MATGGDSKTTVLVQHNCDICKQDGEQNDAKYYCKQCLEYLCVDCKEAHSKVTISRSHRVMKIKVGSGTASVLFTSDEMHECEPCKSDGYDTEANHYCGSCKEYMCGTCGNYHRKFKLSKDHVLTDLHGPTHMNQAASYRNKTGEILGLSSQSSRKVNVKLANDKNVPGITGCTFLSSGELLLCDERNYNIKLLNTSLAVSDSVHVESRPWDVAAVDDNTAIATLPNAKRLLYLELVPKLSIGSKLSIKLKCFGITVVKKLIYVTCHDGPATPGGDIRVLDLRGNELKKIGINRDGSQFLRMPFRIAANREGNKLYVTDCSTDEITCLQPSDNIIYKLKDDDIIAPYGVYVDSKDNLFVCSRDNNTVHVIAANGTKYKNLLVSKDGVQKPIGIAFRPTDSTLIVSPVEKSEILAFKLRYK